jgi:hypothetical protein
MYVLNALLKAAYLLDRVAFFMRGDFVQGTLAHRIQTRRCTFERFGFLVCAHCVAIYTRSVLIRLTRWLCLLCVKLDNLYSWVKPYIRLYAGLMVLLVIQNVYTL